jgi:hypothetical protein
MTGGTGNARPVRRPSPGDAAFTPGLARSWAEPSQVPGQNTGLTIVDFSGRASRNSTAGRARFRRVEPPAAERADGAKWAGALASNRLRPSRRRRAKIVRRASDSARKHHRIIGAASVKPTPARRMDRPSRARPTLSTFHDLYVPVGVEDGEGGFGGAGDDGDRRLGAHLGLGDELRRLRECQYVNRHGQISTMSLPDARDTEGSTSPANERTPKRSRRSEDPQPTSAPSPLSDLVAAPLFVQADRAFDDFFLAGVDELRVIGIGLILLEQSLHRLAGEVLPPLQVPFDDLFFLRVAREPSRPVAEQLLHLVIPDPVVLVPVKGGDEHVEVRQ